MEHKIADLSDIKVIDEAAGIVEAFTNSMGIVDSDLDIIEISAFDNSIKNNLPIPALVAHDPSAVVGKVISALSVESEDGTARLYNRIQFNLDTQMGREAFSNVSGGFVRSWSVGFNIPDGAVEMDRQDGTAVRRIKDLDWVEVSSVLRGASPDTATISAKSEVAEDTDELKIVIPPHDTGVIQEPWSGADNTRRLNRDDKAAYEEAFAYLNYGSNPDAKSSYRFIHHEVSGGGNVGDANVVACQTGIGVLNGARGGTTIPESDKQGVWKHLAKHLEDGGFEPPELKDALPDATAADIAAEVRADRVPAETDASEGLVARLLTARLRRAKNVFKERLDN